MKFNLLQRILYWYFFLISISLFFCSVLAYNFDEGLMPYLITGLISITISLVIYFLPLGRLTFKSREHYNYSFIVLIIFWLSLMLIGSIPFILSDVFTSPVDSIFESVSGFTTTGSSVCPDIEILPRSLLLWRSLTHWLGGLATIIMVSMIFSFLNHCEYVLFEFNTYQSEYSNERFEHIVFLILGSYFILTLIEVIFLFIGGLGFLDSICLSFGTVATGSFSTYNSGISGLTSYQRTVILVIMILSGINYLNFYHLYSGKPLIVFRNREIRIYFFILLFLSIMIAGMHYFDIETGDGISFREIVFSSVSIVTTTGYASGISVIWPDYIWVVFMFFMIIGGSAITTCGGIKISKIEILYENILLMFKNLSLPNKNNKLKYNESTISYEVVISIQIFVILFFIIVFAGIIIFFISGIDLKTSAIYSISSLTNTGLDFTGSNYRIELSNLPSGLKVIMMCLMLIGRLEVYAAIFFLLYPFHFIGKLFCR